MSVLARHFGLPTLLLTFVVGCGESAKRDDEVRAPTRVGQTRGSAVVLSNDERVAVVSNRSAGVVTVFQLDPAQPPEQLIRGSVEIDLGRGSEPWAAVIGADDDTAYVISRRDQLVHRLIGLHREPRLDTVAPVRVGSEPTAIVISPRGTRIYVANWGEGTISAITTYGFSTPDPIDLNTALVQTGALGDVAVRSALAHPRALAITDDGDDDDADETLYATEFFSQPLRTVPTLDEQFDRNRQGIVYPIELAQGEVGTPIRIAPVQDTGFFDSKNVKLPAGQQQPTSCFPNQLYAAAVAGERLFVTSMCASPAGPVGVPADDAANTANFKTVMHPALFVIDTVNGVELPEQGRVLTRELESLYAADQSEAGRMPLIPNDIAFSRVGEGPLTGYITALGADAVFALKYDDTGLIDIGSSGARFMDLHGDGPLRPRLPVGIAVSQRQGTPFALAVNDTRQTLSVLDPKSNAVIAVPVAAQTAHAAETLQSLENRGRSLFATGLRGWSFKGQAWNSCEGCHPDGLSDGLTWFFTRGPRRTISTSGTFDAEGHSRMMLWTASVDEIHDVEVIVRSVAGGAGGVLWTYTDFPTNDLRILYDGTPPPDRAGTRPKKATTLRSNLNDSVAELLKGDSCTVEPCDSTPLTDWHEIEAYVKSVRTPLPPVDLDEGQKEAGKRLFDEGRCAGCHAGPGFTLSKVFYKPGEENGGRLPYEKPASFDRTELLGLLRTTSYTLPPDVPELSALNPPGASGTATFRRWAPDAGPEIDFAYKLPPDANDQVNCVLRAVGTFPEQVDGALPNTLGIVPVKAPAVRELRQDMTTLAVGKTGFNIPSLVGLGAGAPYFHAGNARTLEELFDPAFSSHHQALNHEFLPADQSSRSDRVRALVVYLLSIDDTTPAPAVDPRFDLCSQAAAAGIR